MKTLFQNPTILRPASWGILRPLAMATAMGALAAAGPDASAEPETAAESSESSSGHAGEPASPPFLGIHPVRISEELATHLRLDEGIGLRVEFVQPGSPAEESGLERHDVIVSLDDQWLTHPEQLAVLVRNRAIGESVTLSVIHRGGRVERKVTLTERPAELATQGDPLVIERFEALREADPDSPRRQLEELVEKALEKSSRQIESAGELPQRLREMLEKALGEAKLPRRDGDAAAEGDGSPGAEQPQSPGGTSTQSSSSVSISLGTGEGLTINLTETDGRRHLKAVDRDGAVLYDGPFTGDPEADGIPARVREKLHLLDNIEIHTESKVETR